MNHCGTGSQFFMSLAKEVKELIKNDEELVYLRKLKIKVDAAVDSGIISVCTRCSAITTDEYMSCTVCTDIMCIECGTSERWEECAGDCEQTCCTNCYNQVGDHTFLCDTCNAHVSSCGVENCPWPAETFTARVCLGDGCRTRICSFHAEEGVELCQDCDESSSFSGSE